MSSFLLFAGWLLISGTVRDSTGAPVPYASVNLHSKSTDAIVAYTTTLVSGGYVLTVPAAFRDSSLYVEVRCIGFQAQRKAVDGIPAVIDFILAVSANELRSVVVRNNRPRLRTSGDTVSYKVSDFSAAQDRVIGDVLKRMPGITVGSDGSISYNNKPVSGVYLGGDNLLDDKYSIATNTIPQAAVDQVQVIDNHQPIKALQNKVSSDDVALNLTFKKSAKAQVLGQESVGAGLPGNYDVDLNALLVKDRYKAIDYIKGNNTGDDLQQELASHNLNDYKLRIGNDPPASLLSLGVVNNPALSRDRYFFDQSGLLNANNLVNLKSGVQLRVNASYLHDWEKQDYSQNTSVFLPGDTVQYSETQHNRFEPDLLHAQFVINVNKARNYFNDALLLDDNRWKDHSSLNTNGTVVNQTLLDHPVNFSNEFNLIRPVHAGDLVQVYSYVSRMVEPENLGVGQMVQRVNVPTWYTNDYVTLMIPDNIGTKSFTVGGSSQWQRLVSGLDVLQSNGSVEPAMDSSTNQVSWNKNRLYARGAYDIVGEELKANLTLPLLFERIGYSDAGSALDKQLGRLYFNPALNIKYKTGPENFVTLLYRYRNLTGTIEDVYPGYILKDYRTLYANDADLTLKQDHLVAAGYNYRRAMTLLFFSFTGSYQYISANNIASSVISNNFQKQVVLSYPNGTRNWSLDGTVSKYSFPLRTTFSGEVKWQDSRMVQVENGSTLPFSTSIWTLTLGATTKLSSQVNFSYVFTGNRTFSSSIAEVPPSGIELLQQQGTVYYNPSDDLQFKLSGESFFTHSTGNPDLNYFFADASGKFHWRRRKVDLQLDFRNFLNVKTYRAFYLQANTFTSSSYTLLGRIVLLKVLFNI